MTSAIGMSEGMNDVKRFDCLDWRYSDDGSCVDYADYEALQQERDALQQQLAAAREEMAELTDALRGLFADGAGVSYASWTREQHAAYAALCRANGAGK